MLCPNAILVLDDKSFFWGNFIGFPQKVRGELCFNTSMTGYQEVISDPSYYGQIVVFTFPHIGNIGINSENNESSQAFLRGLVMANPITPPSHYKSEEHLENWLKNKNVTGICNVNTRNLVKKVRSAKNPIKCVISPLIMGKEEEIIDLLYAELKKENGISGQNYSSHVQQITSHKQPKNKSKKKLIILDFGLKNSILQALQSDEYQLVIMPGNSSANDILKQNPVGIILSNGPGDPRSMINDNCGTIQQIINLEIPLLGICLGFQLIGLTLGGRIAQLPCGHHGSNHPVYHLFQKKTFITSQNHEFHLLADSLPSCIEPAYFSLFDKSLEGFQVKGKPIIAVQFHPEGSPGPNDCKFIFLDFLKMVKHYDKKK